MASLRIDQGAMAMAVSKQRGRRGGREERHGAILVPVSVGSQRDGRVGACEGSRVLPPKAGCGGVMGGGKAWIHGTRVRVLLRGGHVRVTDPDSLLNPIDSASPSLLALPVPLALT